jgi:very-short-patch-repair endonuclease
LARGAQSSNRRAQLSQANPDRTLFRGLCCLARKIVVEADGRTHETADAKIKDAQRDEWFRRAGFRVLRFPDELIIGGLPIVIERVRAALRET